MSGAWRSGWRTALTHALLAFGATLLLSEVSTAGGALAGGGSIFVALRRGAAGFLLSHGVPVSVEAATGTRISIRLMPLIVTSLAVVLAYRGGRAAAERAQGGPLVRGLRGLQVAIPYALFCLALSRVATFSMPAPIVFANSPLSAGDVVVRPDPVAAFVGPLILAGASAFLGGSYGSLREYRWAAGAVAGGLRMFLAGLVLSYAGLLIVLALNPGLRQSVTLADRFFGRRVSLIAAAPNHATWVLVPSMGACDTARGLDAGGIDVLCYGSFPSDGAFGRAPAPYLVFLLVPATSTVLGGGLAAQRARTSALRAAAIGAGAGAVFAVLVAVASAASAIAVSGVIGGRAFSFRAGPDVLSGTLLALAWGCIGGAIGGAIAGRRALEDEETPAA